MSHFNSAVNTSVPITQSDSQPLEATSTSMNTAEANSANMSTSCQRPSLNLSHSVPRSETLESPAYIPSDFSILPNDIAQIQGSELMRPDKQQAVSETEMKNKMEMSSDAHQSPNVLASISIETETPSPTYEKLLPVQQASAGKTSKFAASVRRKFTVSKTVLPSNAAPQVVVFSKLASEVASPRDHEVQHADDVGRVHIVDKALSSNVSALDKSPVSGISSAPNGGDVTDVQPVTDVPTASTGSLESAVIIKTSEPCADSTSNGESSAVSQLEPTASKCDLELAASSEVQNVACDENVDSQVRDECCDGNTDKSVEMCRSLWVKQCEVDSTAGSCAASELTAAETSTLSCRSDCMVNDGDGPVHTAAADLRDITIVGDKCGMVAASQYSCPSTVSDVSLNCTATKCSSELESLQCATDELPSSDASVDALMAEITDALSSCSTAEQTVDMPFEASSLLSEEYDTLQQNLDRDSSSQIAESVPTVAAAQCSRQVQAQIDDTS